MNGDYSNPTHSKIGSQVGRCLPQDGSCVYVYRQIKPQPDNPASNWTVSLAEFSISMRHGKNDAVSEAQSVIDSAEVHMVSVTLTPKLEQAVVDRAQLAGTSPQEFVLGILEKSLLPASGVNHSSIDEWEQALLAASVDCGVSLSDEAVSSEGLYD